MGWDGGFKQSRIMMHCVPPSMAAVISLPSPPDNVLHADHVQVSAHSSSLTTVPYPMPPVGADPNTWRPDEEPPPLHFTVKLPERLLVPAAVRVGWWDTSRQAWSEEGIRCYLMCPTVTCVLTLCECMQRAWLSCCQSVECSQAGLWFAK